MCSNCASNVTITNNIITSNDEFGMSLSFSSPSILYNRVTGSGIYDIILMGNGTTPNISFNVYDTISGTTGVGMYNVKSDGTPAIEP